MAALVGVLAPVEVRGEDAPKAFSDAEIFRTLDVAFGTTGPVPANADRAERFREFMRSRLAQNSFYSTVLPEIFFVYDFTHPLVNLALKRGTLGGQEFYYLDRPCPKSQWVSVKPWWNLNTVVSVCTDAYRPELKTDTRLGTVRYCDYTYFNAVESLPRICRCGEHLINCAKDSDQQGAMVKAAQDELSRTIQYLVQGHKRLSEIMVMNETVRTALGDFIYARDHYLETGELRFSPVGDRDEPTLRPREDRYTGGVLTMPLFTYERDNHRGKMADSWADFMCIPLASTPVHANQLFSIVNHADRLRTGSHMELADKVGCRDCHARLENALLAFTQFSDIRYGLRYMRDAVSSGTIKFFGLDYRDLRDEGPATPLWVGQTIAKQPEFVSCMVKKVEDFVFNGHPPPAEIHSRLVRQFTADQDLGRLFEDTIVSRYVGVSGLH